MPNSRALLYDWEDFADEFHASSVGRDRWTIDERLRNFLEHFFGAHTTEHEMKGRTNDDDDNDDADANSTESIGDDPQPEKAFRTDGLHLDESTA
jgi:hypothetical protein